jgi:two-component system sensor histidine kinase/response regulator
MATILVIEDETPIRVNILEMLELEGFDTLEADNGRTGLDLARQQTPDLIICDITMPELDGYEVLLELQKSPQTASIPFIFLTARADRSFMRHGMELGADDYLTKPFTLAELRAAISARLERRRAINDSVGLELEQAKRTLVQLVSHELRTPLVAINTATEIISRQIGQLETAQLEDLLESIRRGGQRLGHLVDQIVLIVQIETGALHYDTIQAGGLPLRLADVLIGARDLARGFAFGRNDVSLRVDERDSEAMVLGEMRALKHALAELIANALTFSPAGSEVTLSQWVAGDAVWLSIVDHGPGIPAEQVQQALEDFQQLDRAAREQQGIGLGLPLARRIFQAHGGTFELNSKVGTGTQVTVSLPLWRQDGENPGR